MINERVIRFCEAVRGGIATPANAWSSILFFGAVAIVLFLHIKHSKRSLFASSLYSYTYVAIVALIGITSFWNHATFSFWGGLADFESMFLFITFAIGLGIKWHRDISARTLFASLLIVNVPLSYVAGQAARITDYTFLALVLLLIAIEIGALRKARENALFFWLALASLTVGYFIWQLDVRKIWCNPTSLLQGHAVWHLLTALATGLLYFHLLGKPAQQNSAQSDINK